VTSRADEYRRLARECLAMAHMMATEETRASLIAMAQAWHRLAEEQEASVPPSAVEQFQPAVQQQQQQRQVQPKDDDDTG
jgi:hypothetical protein